MANSKPANSLETLLQRKRPAKQRGPQDSWTLDDLTNAGGMHGIREFVEQALSVESVAPSDFPSPVSETLPVTPGSGESEPSKSERSNLEGSKFIVLPISAPYSFESPAKSNTDTSKVAPYNYEATKIEGSNFMTSTAPVPMPASQILTKPLPPSPRSLASLDDLEPQVTEASIQETLQSATPENPPRRISFRQVRSIQDGLARNELATLSTLWTKGREGDASGNFRLITIGDRTLARVLNVSDNSVRNLRNALLDKLAIQVHHANVAGPKGGKTYIVFSYAEILRRWRKNGLVLASQRTAGAVALCDASGHVLAPRALLASASSRKFDPSNFNFAPSYFDPSNFQPAPTNFDPSDSKFDPSSFAPLIRNKTNQANQPAAPGETAHIVHAVAAHLGSCDQQFAERLITACRSNTVDATVDEIEYFVQTTLPPLVRNTAVQSKTGVLLSRAASTFSGESLRQLRAGLQSYRMERARQVIQRSSHHTADEIRQAYEILGEGELSRRSETGYSEEPK